MIEIKNKFECCGCAACANVCPKDAISMVEDEYGFKYPKINKEKCVECGLCQKVCPIINKKIVENLPKSYACINQDEDIRQQSSSGGIFSLIANWILKQNGVVFGAAFDKEFNLNHIWIERTEELYRLRTSKYFQSNINASYKEARKFLDNGRLVLFTGTPCQIEGLKSYLNKEYCNLYTQDIICHGVPSPKVWRKYKEFRKKKDGQVPNAINFRNKDKGWHTFSLKFSYEQNIYAKTQNRDIFMQAFLNNLCLRDSCYKCSFKKYNRVSDITLADFWGIENINEELNDDKGTSLVIVNSNKGEEIFNSIKSHCILEKVSLDEAIKYNSSFIASVPYNESRDDFFKELDDLDFDTLVKKYVPQVKVYRSVLGKIKRVIKKLIRVFMKNRINE